MTTAVAADPYAPREVLTHGIISGSELHYLSAVYKRC